MSDIERALRHRQRALQKKEEKRMRFRGYSNGELESYYNAVYQLYRTVLQSKADAILIPLRGAEPFMRAVQLFASLERKSAELPKFYTLRIGARVEAPKGGLPEKALPKSFGKYLPSVSPTEQSEAIKNKMAKIAKESGKTQLHLLLIDEVQQGGSILKQQNFVENTARELGLRINLETFAVARAGEPKSTEFKQRVLQGRIKVFEAKRVIPCDNFKFLIQQVQTIKGEKLRTSKAAANHRLGLLTDLQKRFQRNRRK